MSKDVVARLQGNILSTLSDLIPKDDNFALLDFPDHDNIGDSAIYIGEHDLFRKLGRRPSYVSTKDHHSWKDMESMIGNGPIFIHGGGNFGDLWPAFNNFHEEILRRNPSRRIIQMPQTIFYRDPENAARMAALCAVHQDFILLVRDQKSFEFATQNFKADIRMCPDSAFMIETITRTPPIKELLLFLRQDQEARESHPFEKYASKAGVIHADWPEEVSSSSRVQRALDYLKANAHEPHTLLSGSRHDRRRNFLNMTAQVRIKRGMAFLSQARLVITDRLHGHILCTLMGIPHCVIDNSYGKVSGFAEAWGTFGEHRYLAGSLDEAVSILKEREGLVLP